MEDTDMHARTHAHTDTCCTVKIPWCLTNWRWVVTSILNKLQITVPFSGTSGGLIQWRMKFFTIIHNSHLLLFGAALVFFEDCWDVFRLLLICLQELSVGCPPAISQRQKRGFHTPNCHYCIRELKQTISHAHRSPCTTWTSGFHKLKSNTSNPWREE